MLGLTTGTMLGALGQLVDALTGLERILSTPVPWGVRHPCLRRETFLIYAHSIKCICGPLRLFGSLLW
jgi:putative membrane protein